MLVQKGTGLAVGEAGQADVLPRVDRQFLLYQRWLAERLATIEDPEHRRLLQRFAAWHQMRSLRSKAEKGPLGGSQTNQTNQTKRKITQAGAFLAQLADRGAMLKTCGSILGGTRRAYLPE
ncbi:hypothetical protein GCM10009864_74550 [Streptomyces lunalinharesii]|uniref:Uncharacterized protein n=1 Tax=Streptomyces lunalinharesii TaxID=333384 RepID=A0ABN3T0X6_9ACTN